MRTLQQINLQRMEAAGEFKPDEPMPQPQTEFSFRDVGGHRWHDVGTGHATPDLCNHASRGCKVCGHLYVPYVGE